MSGGHIDRAAIAEPLDPYAPFVDVDRGSRKFRLNFELSAQDFEHGGSSIDKHRLARRLTLHVARQGAFLEMQFLLPVIREDERRVPRNRDR